MICNINALCLWWFYARRKLSRREHNEMNTTVTVMFPHLQYVLFTVNHISVFLVSVTVEILQLKIQNQMQAQQSAGPAKAWDTVARRETQSLGIHWRAGLCRSLKSITLSPHCLEYFNEPYDHCSNPCNVL